MLLVECEGEGFGGAVNSGLQWQVPYAETPDNVRNNPALKGIKIGNTGQPGCRFKHYRF